MQRVLTFDTEAKGVLVKVRLNVPLSASRVVFKRQTLEVHPPSEVLEPEASAAVMGLFGISTVSRMEINGEVLEISARTSHSTKRIDRELRIILDRHLSPVTIVDAAQVLRSLTTMREEYDGVINAMVRGGSVLDAVAAFNRERRGYYERLVPVDEQAEHVWPGTPAFQTLLIDQYKLPPGLRWVSQPTKRLGQVWLLRSRYSGGPIPLIQIRANAQAP